MTVADDVTPSADYDAPEPWWRVTITFGALTKVNTARRRFRCEGHIAPVQHYIDPGQRYVRTSLPPDHPEINNDGWWHMRLCMACCPVEFTRPLPSGSDQGGDRG